MTLEGRTCCEHISWQHSRQANGVCEPCAMSPILHGKARVISLWKQPEPLIVSINSLGRLHKRRYDVKTLLESVIWFPSLVQSWRKG